jgi:hypothetical protein
MQMRFQFDGCHFLENGYLNGNMERFLEGKNGD